jgi:transposase InsO family protein
MDKAGRADVPTNVCPSRRSRAPGVIGRVADARDQAHPHRALYPKTNGKAERLVQTALREWAYTRAYRHSDQRAAELPYWLHRYNWHPQSRSGQFLSHMNPDVSSAGAQDTALF